MTDSKPSEIGPGIDRWLYLVQVGCPLVRPFHDIWDQDFGAWVSWQMSCRIGRKDQQKTWHRMSDDIGLVGGMASASAATVGQQAVLLAVQQSPSQPSPDRLGVLGDWLRVRGLALHHMTWKHNPDIESHELEISSENLIQDAPAMCVCHTDLKRCRHAFLPPWKDD